MGYLGGPNVRVRKGERFRDTVLLVTKMEERATIQGIEVVSELEDARKQILL